MPADDDLAVVAEGDDEQPAEDLTDDVRGVVDALVQVRDAGLFPDKAAIGLDPAGVATIVDELAARGFTDEQMRAIPQGWKLSSAIKGSARKVAAKTMRHGGTALMAWCVGNVKQEPRGASGVAITKQTPSAKIDPVAAMFNAVMLMSENPEAGAAFVYRRLLPQQLFWFTGISDGGMRPLVPWKQAKGAIDFQLALEVGARAFFRNDRRPSGVLSTEQTLTDGSASRLKDGVERWKRGGTPVLEAGVKYLPVGTSNVDSQLVELIKQRTLEMGRYWRIPRSIIGDEGGNAGNNEQDTRGFVNFALRPLTRRIEQAITVRLLPPSLRAQRVRAKFNLDSMLRGDAATQWKNAVLARTASVLSTNELRVGWFGQARIEEDWADDPRTPLNSNRAADTMSGGETAPQDKVE